MSARKSPLKLWARKSFLACAAVAALAGTAHAENHALIMWIGDYAEAENNLPGIDKDAALARQIAAKMGVAQGNIIEMKNRDLSLDGMKRGISQLAGRIQNGDRVFIYYSGHGGQIDNQGGKCSEGMVSHDGRLYFDKELEGDLDRLASKASQVVMLNDSCFSGGAATENDTKSLDGQVAKVYKGKVKSGSSGGGESYTCGDAVNKMTRNLKVAADKRGTQMVYLAASSEREVSYASPLGSVGTLAWASCLQAPQGDANNDGLINAEELRQCAQRYVDTNGRRRQTITLVGSGQVPVFFSTPLADGAAAVNPAHTLEAVRAASDPAMQLTLTLASQSLSISRQDKLDFSVNTPRAGYLNILHVGSDGKTFDVLFPNAIDTNNYVNAGTHRLPRAGWAVQASGPVGTGYVMAVISDTPKNFRDGMGKAGPFASTKAVGAAASKLVVVAVGANQPGAGRFGASAVVPVVEVQ